MGNWLDELLWAEKLEDEVDDAHTDDPLGCAVEYTEGSCGGCSCHLGHAPCSHCTGLAESPPEEKSGMEFLDVVTLWLRENGYPEARRTLKIEEEIGGEGTLLVITYFDDGYRRQTVTSRLEYEDFAAQVEKLTPPEPEPPAGGMTLAQAELFAKMTGAVTVNVGPAVEVDSAISEAIANIEKLKRALARAKIPYQQPKTIDASGFGSRFKLELPGMGGGNPDRLDRLLEAAITMLPSRSPNTMLYRVLNGVNFPGRDGVDVRAEKGDVISYLPPASLPWLIRQNIVQPMCTTMGEECSCDWCALSESAAVDQSGWCDRRGWQLIRKSV